MAPETFSWTAAEVQLFLSIIGEEEGPQERDGAVRDENIFRLVVDRMAAHGFARTPAQCRSKLKKLRSDYRRVKEHNRRSGSQRKHWRWYKAMDAIYGHRQASQGRDGGLDTATGLLEGNERASLAAGQRESSGSCEAQRSSAPLHAAPQTPLCPASSPLPPAPTPPPVASSQPRPPPASSPGLSSALKRLGTARRTRDDTNSMVLAWLRDVQTAERTVETQGRSPQTLEQESSAARQDFTTEGETLGDKFLRGVAMLVQALRQQRDLPSAPSH